MSSLLPDSRAFGGSQAATYGEGDVTTRPHQAPAPNAAAELTAAVIEIFGRVLGLAEGGSGAHISEDSNFFDEGGDSLLAISLIAELERVTGTALSITSLYDAPTVAEIVQLISVPTEAEPSPLVTLRPGDAAPALFLVHGIGGSSLEQLGLATAIATPHAVYGIQSESLYGQPTTLRRVEDMAAHYLREVKRVQPSGPYAFAGYSFGGLIALEMAQQARAAGDEIGVLALLDTYPTIKIWPWMWRVHVWVRLATHHVSIARRMPASAVPTYLAGRLRTWRRLLNGQNSAMRAFEPAPISAVLDAVQAARQANVAAHLSYRPAPYGGTLLFIRSSNELRLPNTPEVFWRRIAKSLRVVAITGDKANMIRENVGAAAAVLTGALQNVSPPGTTPAKPDYARPRLPA